MQWMLASVNMHHLAAAGAEQQQQLATGPAVREWA